MSIIDRWLRCNLIPGIFRLQHHIGCMRACYCSLFTHRFVRRSKDYWCSLFIGRLKPLCRAAYSRDCNTTCFTLIEKTLLLLSSLSSLEPKLKKIFLETYLADLWIGSHLRFVYFAALPLVRFFAFAFHVRYSCVHAWPRINTRHLRRLVMGTTPVDFNCPLLH